MSLFIIRIELHGVTLQQDYELLHGVLLMSGVTREVVDKNLIRLHLPDGLYACLSDRPTDDIRSMVCAAIESLNFKHTTFVALTDGAWSAKNLKPV